MQLVHNSKKETSDVSDRGGGNPRNNENNDMPEMRTQS